MAFRDVLVQEVTFEHPYPMKEELNELLNGYGIHNQEYAYRMSKIAPLDDVSFGPSYRDIQDRMSLILHLKLPTTQLKLNKYKVPRYLIDDIVRDQCNKLLVTLHDWDTGAFEAIRKRLHSNKIDSVDNYELYATIGYLLKDKFISYERLNCVSDEELVEAFNYCHGRVFQDRYLSDLQLEVNGVLVNTMELGDYCTRALSQEVLSDVSKWEEGIEFWCEQALTNMTIGRIVNEFELALLPAINKNEPFRKYLVTQKTVKKKLKYPISSREYKYILGLLYANNRHLIKTGVQTKALAAQYLYYIISGNPIVCDDGYEKSALIHDILVLYGYLEEMEALIHKEKADRVKRFFETQKETGLYIVNNYSSLISQSDMLY